MRLTRKQIHIILLIAEGMGSEEIALHLGLSRLTVDNQRKMALKNSGYRTWSQFMAQTGMSGELKRWREVHEIRFGAINGHLELENDEAE